MGYKFSWSPRGALMNMLSGAKYLKDGHPVMVDKDGGYKIYKKQSSNLCTRFLHITSYFN